ncbi:hypothetical protein D3C78_1346930 [compost metagenome]
MHAPVLLGQVQQPAEVARETGSAAEVLGVVQAHLDVRVGAEHAQLVVAAVAADVVDQDAHPHPAVRRAQQLMHQRAGGEAVVDDVVLQVDAALRLADEFPAGDQGVGAGSQQAEAGLPGMRLGMLVHRGAEVGPVRRQRVRGRRRRAGAAAEQEQGQQQEAWQQAGVSGRSAGSGLAGNSSLPAFP